MTKSRLNDQSIRRFVMAGAGVGSGQDHDALTAARFEISLDGAAQEPRLASSMQNAEPEDDSDDEPSLLANLSETTEMTKVGDSMDRLAAADDAEIVDDLEETDL
jgi:hypothetical protein